MVKESIVIKKFPINLFDSDLSKSQTYSAYDFQTYIKDTSRSLNGRYTITSTQEMDKDRIGQKWSDFFKIDQATLLEPTYKSAVEVINRDLLLSAIVFCLGYFASCVSDSVSTDDGDEKSWGTKITWFSR